MRIKEIELRGFTPFSLHRINHFKYTFNNKITVLVGDSGSGKSSLMNQLLPHTFHPSLFTSEGYKRLVIDKDGHEYTIENYLDGKTAHYSIKKDEEELNPSLNVTSFKTIVDREFGLNADTAQLLLGKVSFTDLNATKRRDWLLTFTQNALEKAFRLYELVREELKDIAVIVKHIQQDYTRLSAEKAQQTTEYTEEQLTRLSEQIHYLLKTLPHRPSSSLDDLLKQHRITLEALSDHRDQLLKLSRQLSTTNLESLSVATAQQTIQQLTGKLDALTQTRTEIEKELQELESTLQISASHPDHEGIKTRLSAVEASLKNYATQAYYATNVLSKLPVTDLVKLKAFVDNFVQQTKATIQEIQQDLHQYQKPLDQVVQALTAQQTALQTQSAQLRTQIHELTLKIAEQEKAKQHVLTCPNCDHAFSLNYNPTLHQSLQAQHTQLTTQVATLSHQEKQLADQITTIKQSLYVHTKYQQYIASTLSAIRNDEIRALFQHIFKDVNHTLPLLKDLDFSLSNHIDIGHLQQEKVQLESISKVFEKSHATSHAVLQNRFQQLSQEYGHLRTQIEQIRTEIQHQTQIAAKAEQLTRLNTEIQQFLAQIKQMRKDIMDHLRHQGSMAIVQSTIAYTDAAKKAASARANLLAKIDELEARIKELQHREQQFTILEKVLSPKGGLIARELTKYLNTLLNEMNRLIERIWRYQLNIKAVDIEMENKNLDFKLSFTYEGNTIPELKDASSGMKEVLDLSFRIVMMRYLRLIGYPLMLDEFASRMDPEHRKVAFKTVEDLSHTTLFSQMFVISHDYGIYGRLNNTDIINLNQYVLAA